MGKNKKYRDRGYGHGKSRLIDPDGDVDMGGPPRDRQYNPYAPKSHNSKKKHRKQQQQQGSGNRRSNNQRRQTDMELFPWHRITIPFGRKFGKTFILKSLSSLCKGHFNPYNFQFIGNAAEFFLDSYDTAREVKDMHKRITTPDGFKMVINVAKCPMPSMSFDPETIDIIKKVMSGRYDSMSHCLNLSKFHYDTSLKALGLYLPLQKPSVLSAIAKVIKENIPELHVLDLSGNKLTSLDSLSIITYVCKELKSLTLRNNKLRSVTNLSSIKGLDIMELVLDGNPLCDDFKDKDSYISAVRDYFPKLTHLDGATLPATIGFDLGTETLPVSKKSFFAADDVKDMVIQFLDLYYTIYDSGDRSKLVDAYHDQAYFSLYLPKSNHYHKQGKGTLAAYTYHNRNLLNMGDSSQRYKLLRQGKINIVSTISDLPQTMHDPTSFNIDIFHISPNLMSFSVTGVFKEVGAEINEVPLKCFSRTYIVAPHGQGLVITNESFFISIATEDQKAKAFKVPAPTPSTSPAHPNEEKNPNEKQLMVIELSKHSGMNVDFSAKCLEECDWDYQRAVAVFLKFQSEGKLPPEAFIHQ
ncbi:hypothetical protein JTE90_002695 [Oedothorax gibbosus]|uniref:Nuclear RNA export factor 1 n=1 Tax=Oedothorax gibbosus TaxID=931172 RepID=A0AAV6VYU8_9ARAC|nr:hypothetical protein JTE90_002695 [Oedothorax gibbosus]